MVVITRDIRTMSCWVDERGGCADVGPALGIGGVVGVGDGKSGAPHHCLPMQQLRPRIRH